VGGARLMWGVLGDVLCTYVSRLTGWRLRVARNHLRVPTVTFHPHDRLVFLLRVSRPGRDCMAGGGCVAGAWHARVSAVTARGAWFVFGWLVGEVRRAYRTYVTD
jgi:hypothetical protein